MLDNIFKLKENNTTIHREISSGIVTFFAMSYILFVNPSILSQSGIPFQAVFLATIISSVVGTLIMGLFANIPFAQAPGMGLNAFFTFNICFGLGYSWKEALGIVFLCGLINLIITVTHIRKKILESIPKFLQHAIGGGIGIFVAYVGFKNAGFLNFISDDKTIMSIDKNQNHIINVVSNGNIVPELAKFNHPEVIVSLIGLIITIILVIKKVPGSLLISIILTTIIAIPLGIINLNHFNLSEYSLIDSFKELKITFLAPFTSEGLPSLFSNINELPTTLITILAFSLSDIFDTMGSLIGASRNLDIFQNEQKTDKKYTTMDRALVSDSIATMTGSLFGTSNVITYVESATGIAAGGRTGLTALTVAILFASSSIFAPFIQIVPTQATASVLIIVGMMMVGSFTEINWNDMQEVVPSFFIAIFMGLCYSISNGIALGLISYTLIKLITGKLKEIKPMLWIVTILFICNFILQAII